LATKKDCFYEAHEMPRLIKTALVVPGTRLEIYWPHEQLYYKALIKSEQCRKRENYWICYESRKSCADREWIDLHRHKFRVLETPPESPPHQHVHSNSKEDVVVMVQPDASDENDESLDSWGKTTSCGEFPMGKRKRSDVIASVPKAITSAMPEDNISLQSSIQFEMDETKRNDLPTSPTNQAVAAGVNEMNAINIEKVSPGSSTSRCSVIAKICELDAVEEAEASNSPLSIVSNESSPRKKSIVEKPEEITCDSLDSALESKIINVDAVTPVAVTHETPRKSKEDKEEGIIIDPDSDLATRSAVCSLIEVGSRVAVYWEEDDEFFPGTITDRSFRGKPFYLEYDDGEGEWIDLRKHRFRLLPPAVNDDTVTSRRRRSSNSSDVVLMSRTRKQQQHSIAVPNGDPSFTEASTDSRQTLSSAKNDTPLSQRNTSSHSVRTASDQRNVAKSKLAVQVKNAVDDLSDSSVSAESEWSLDSPRTKRPVDRRERVEADIAKITVGSRVAVWWDGDKKYYNGVVQRQRAHKKPFYLVYDDGEAEEWMDFRQQKFKLLSDDSIGEMQRKRDRDKVDSEKKVESIETLRVKRRKSDYVVLKDKDSPTKVRTRRSETYARSDPEKNFSKQTEGKRKYSDSPGADSSKSSPDVCSLITVGSRVAVYWEGESKYYEGVVTRERSSSKRRHYLEYDDGEAAHWIDFREHWVRILPDNTSRRSKRPSISATNKKFENDEAIFPDTPVMTRSKKQMTSAEMHAVAQTAPLTRNRLSATAESLSKVSKTKNSTKRESPDRSTSSRGSVSDISTPRVVTSKVKQKVGKGKSFHEEEGKDKRTLRKSGKGKATHEATDNEKGCRGMSEIDKVQRETFDYDKFLSENDESAFELSNFTIGSRVEIWWNGDEKYYTGTISKITPKKFFVLYDDGEVEWVSKTKQKYRLLEPKKKRIRKKTATVNNRKAESYSEDVDDEQSSALEEDHMAYDDFVFGKVDQLRVGSRLSVWWTGDKKYYNGTVKKINDKTGVRRPYFVRYDDHDEEWTDLRRRYFRVLD
jgi:hypothetical protein